MVTVVASGYFNPLHRGHIEYFKLAKELGDKLIVIINNDKQRELKEAEPFMDENERALIVSSLKMVDEVVIAVDTDLSVCQTLENLKPDVFAKGGDKFSYNIPETEVCIKNNIKIVDGLGKKIQSSSWLLR